MRNSNVICGRDLWGFQVCSCNMDAVVWRNAVHTMENCCHYYITKNEIIFRNCTIIIFINMSYFLVLQLNYHMDVEICRGFLLGT